MTHFTNLLYGVGMATHTNTNKNEFTVTKRCGNASAGYLLPGTPVSVLRVIRSTTTNRMVAEVWTAWTNTIEVPVGSLDGLREAVAAGEVPLWEWTPGEAFYRATVTA